MLEKLKRKGKGVLMKREILKRYRNGKRELEEVANRTIGYEQSQSRPGGGLSRSAANFVSFLDKKIAAKERIIKRVGKIKASEILDRFSKK